MDGENSYRHFISGVESAFDDVIKIYYEGLVRFTMRFVKDEALAEDIAIDALTELVVHKHRYNFKVSLKTYLYTIAKNRALNVLKRDKRLVALEKSGVENNPDYSVSPEDEAENEERKNAINKLIDGLSDKQRTAVTLVYIDGASYVEAASAMGVTVKQIDNLLYKAKMRLKNGAELFDL